MWEIRLYDMDKFFEQEYDETTLIKCSDAKPDTESILEIEGKLYRWCAVYPAAKQFFVHEITLKEEPEDEYDDDLKCPFCGDVDENAWERSADDGTIECGNCNSQFEYERDVRVTYTMTPVKRAEIVRIS